MTILAWDGKNLAGDRRVYLSSLSRTTTKVFRFESRPLKEEVLAGFAGSIFPGSSLMHWLREGKSEADFPRMPDGEDGATALVITRDRLMLYATSAVPYLLDYDQHFAVGSGRDYALMAMHLGKTAAEAVIETAAFDTCCGDGVDSVSFDSGPEATTVKRTALLARFVPH